MRKIVLICGLCAVSSSSLHAGRVVTLADTPETIGKLALTPQDIHVEGAGPADIDFASILEADFSDTPFRANYFSSTGITANRLPASWQAEDIVSAETPGLLAYAEGTFTLSASRAQAKGTQNCFFAGQAWTGDGVWTAQVKGVDATDPEAVAGLMVRESLAADATQGGLGASGEIGGAQFGSSTVHFSWSPSGRREYDSGRTPVSVQLPIWLRLTLSGDNLESAFSTDAKTWEILHENPVKLTAAIWAGIFLESHQEKTVVKATLNHVSFTPPPCLIQVVPPGALLRSGSFLAGHFRSLNLDPANPDKSGEFQMDGMTVSIPRSKIAAVTLHPIARSRLADAAAQSTLILKNGDLLTGDIQGIEEFRITVNSLLLGSAPYPVDEVLACVLGPVQAQPAPYEIRLTNGSIIRATGIGVVNGNIVIAEVSGLNVTVAPGQIAQFRAGATEVQNLLEVPWQAAPANATASSAPAPDRDSLVPCWQGSNQEQMMVVPAGTLVEFPLADRFRALALRIALAPDSSPAAQATIRILADGQEVARTPAFVAGNQPGFVEMSLHDPKTVTLEVDSLTTGTRVLFIDPVAIRDKGAP